MKWQTPLFEDPLATEMGGDSQDRSAAAGVFPPLIRSASRLRDGSHIYGTLVSMSDTSISIHSERHGDAVLKRSEVLEMRRIRGDGVIIWGDWKEMWDGRAGRARPEPRRRRQLPRQCRGRAGKTGTAASSARRSEEFPRSRLARAAHCACLTGTAARCSTWRFPRAWRSSFASALPCGQTFDFRSQGDPEQQLRVETWDDELVLAVANQFKSIRKIADTDREVALRIFWDRALRKCSVYTPQGELITQWDFPDDSQTSSGGLELQNKGRDLHSSFSQCAHGTARRRPR